MTLLDVSIVNVALPSIRTGLHAGVEHLQWVVSGYALSFGLLLIPAGRMGDARGRRAVFMTGLVLFTLASAACGAAQSDAWLVTARVAQGLSGGLIAPQISALIQQMFRGAERGRAFGMFGSTIGLSTAVGPVLGGLIIHAAGAQEGWRWVFYVNLPLGVIILVLARRLLPDTPTAGRLTLRRLDPGGVLLLGLGVFALLLPFVQAQQWRGSGKWLWLLVAGTLLGAFVAWEHRWSARGADPVLRLELYRIRSYSAGSVLILLYFAGFTSIFFTSTLYLQSGLHYSALVAGLTLTPFAVGSGVAAAVSGRFVTRLGRPLVAVGLAVVALGLGGTALAVHLVPGQGAGWAMAFPLLVSGLGSGLVISPNQTLTLAEVPVASAGSAGGSLQTGQRVGSAFGIAAVGSVFFERVRHEGWADAYDSGLLVSIAFTVVALLVALGDSLGHRRGRGHRDGGKDRDGPDGARRTREGSRGEEQESGKAPGQRAGAVRRERARWRMKCAVIGGTGRIGSRVVRILKAGGHEVVPYARSTGVDVYTGAGLAGALTGVDVVVDVTRSPTLDAASDFFRTAMDNLLAAADKSGVRHVVVVSIVGVDQVPGVAYYRAKVLQEDILKAGPIPYSIVRATQFFEFIDEILSWSTDDDTVRLPTTRLQPIAAADVARTVAEVAAGSPLMGTRNIAGPDVFPLDELGRITLAARGDQRTVTTVTTEGNAGLFSTVPDGAIIAKDDAHIAHTRYRDWLTG